MVIIMNLSYFTVMASGPVMSISLFVTHSGLSLPCDLNFCYEFFTVFFVPAVTFHCCQCPDHFQQLVPQLLLAVEVESRYQTVRIGHDG